MMRKLLMGAVLAPLFLVGGAAIGADHAESPGADADFAADIGDVYLFRSPENPNRMVAAITFGGRPAPRSRIDTMFYCDPRVIHFLNIERASAAGAFTGTPTFVIAIRYAPSTRTAGRCGIQLESVPGAGGTFFGASETIFASSTGLRAFGGVRNEPFFFDSEGFTNLVASLSGPAPPAGYLATAFGLGTRARRDSFVGRNVSAVVVEMDIDALAPASAGVRPRIRLWGTTARRVS
jgi:hypothetical protein